MTPAATQVPRMPPAKPEKDWLSRKEAAIYLTRKGRTISAGTLANLAMNNNAGAGPSFTRDGWKCVRYARADLDNWFERQSVRVP